LVASKTNDEWGKGHLARRAPFGSDVGKHLVQWPRHPTEIQRSDEQRSISDLPVPHEAPELLLIALSSLGGLLLEGPERPELTLSLDDLFHSRGAERADQLVLQVRIAYVETELFHPGAREVGAEAGAFESAPEVVLLSGIAEACQPDVESLRAEQVEEATDGVRTTHGHDRDALGIEISTTALGQRFERALVADAFDEHNRTSIELSEGGHEGIVAVDWRGAAIGFVTLA
jgi:hypothetical protein